MKPSDVAAALPRDVKKLLDGNQRRMLEAAHLGAEIIADVAPVDVGSLKSSVHVEATDRGARIVIDAPHAGITELGSRPHMPPLAPLIDWVRRHGVGFGLGPTRRRAPKTVTRKLYGAALAAHTRASAQQKAIVQIARAIQMKIAREGTKPRYFVRNAMPRLTAALRSVLSKP